MGIIEITSHAADSERCAMFHIAVNGTEYMIIGGTGSVTVLVGKWINDRRALGKTFWTAADLLANYKRDGRIVLEYARKIANLR